VSESWNSRNEGALSPIGYTGKLPAFGDFVRSNVSSPAAKVFEQWLSEGLAQFPARVGNGWEKSFDAGQNFGFAVNGGDPNSFLVGLSIPSRDRGGRRYPFSLFSAAQAGPEGELFFLLPVAFGLFLEKARQAINESWPSSVDSIYGAKISPLVSTLPRYFKDSQQQFESYLEEKTLGDFWRGLFDSFEVPEKYLLLDNLLKTILPLRRQEAGRFNFALQFPIRGESPGEAGLETAFWIFLCQKILAKPAVPIQAFWNLSAGPNSGLFLFFRPPEAKFFPYLLMPGLENNFIWNLAGLGKDKLQKEKLPPGLVKLLDNPDEKLKSLLNVKEWEKQYGG